MATARVLSFKGGAGLAPALREASRSKGWFGGPHTSAHTRWLVATAGVLSFKGGAGLDHALREASRSKGWFGGPHTRWCAHKVVGGHRKSLVI